MTAKDKKLETELNEPTDEPLDLPTEQATLLPTRLNFKWSEDEQDTIDTIKGAVDQMVQKEYQEAYLVVRSIMNRVREYQLDDSGKAMLDEKGAPVWKRNPDGSVAEDYSRLDASDLDSAILKLATYAFFAGQWSIDAYMEAVFAKYMADDAHSDAFASIRTGTIQDKTVTADKKSRLERYRAFYKAYSHKRIKELIDRMDSLRRSLEFVRKLQADDRGREWRASTR
jgi:hypothetical protein